MATTRGLVSVRKSSARRSRVSARSAAPVLGAGTSRETVGILSPQLRWGGGERAIHSSVFASQGLSGAFLPAKRLQKKLIAKKICATPRAKALQVMNTFHHCRW